MAYDTVTKIAVGIAILIAGYIIGRIVEAVAIEAAEASGLRRKVAFGIERKMKKYGFRADITATIAKLLKYLVFLAALIMLFDFFEVHIAKDVAVDVWRYLPNVVAAVLVIAIGTIFAEFVTDIVKFRLRDYGLDALLSESGLGTSASDLLAALLKYFLYAVVGVIVLSQLGFHVQTLVVVVSAIAIIVFAGIAAVFFFGVKDWIPNVSAGIYLRNAKIVKEGDEIEVAGVRGRVEKIGFTSTEIKSRNGTAYLPNSSLTKEKITVIKRK